MADKKISDLEQISEYNPSAVVPISLFDGYNNVNKKIALTDLYVIKVLENHNGQLISPFQEFPY